MSFAVPERALREIEESGLTVDDLVGVEPPDPQPEPTPTGSSRYCAFCGLDLVSTRNCFQAVEGWTRPRSAGGANQITARRLRDEYACGDCIGKLRRGIDPGQERIL